MEENRNEKNNLPNRGKLWEYVADELNSRFIRHKYGNKRPGIFISYPWATIKGDNCDVQVFKSIDVPKCDIQKDLIELGGYLIDVGFDVHIDTKSNDHGGTPLDEQIRVKIETYDIVLCFLTPLYKAKVENKKPDGTDYILKEEFDLINKRDPRVKKVFRFVMIGDQESSAPKVWWKTKGLRDPLITIQGEKDKLSRLGFILKKVLVDPNHPDSESGDRFDHIWKQLGQNPTVITNDSFFTFGLPDEFSNFTGRTAVLDEIDANLRVVQPGSTSKCIISGTGGIGKTQTAVVSAHRQLKLYQDTKGKEGCRSVIWFIAGTDEGVDNQGLMTEQFHSLGEQLGFDPKVLKLEMLIKQIYQRLSEKHGPFIVVFDNAHNIRSIKHFLPLASISEKVVITTRNNNDRDWESSFRAISLGVFDETEARKYIQKFLSPNHAHLYCEKEADELAKTLGFYPLLLTQALAYITTENIEIKVYLEEFQQQKALYLQEAIPQGDPYQDDKNPNSDRYAARPKEEYDPHKATIWAVIQLSLKKVNNPDANQIIKACAYLAAEAPIDINLLAYWTANTMECRKAVSTLRTYSLLENVKPSGHVRIHQIVQEILRLPIVEEDQDVFLTWIADFITQHHEKRENPLLDENRRNRLFPHLQSLLEHFEMLPKSPGDLEEKKALLQFYVGNYYLRVGKFAEAARYLRRAKEFHESFNKGDQLSVINLNLGVAISGLGDASGSQALTEQALFTLQRDFGQESPEVALALGNKGNALLEQGRIAEASICIEDSLRILQKYYDTDHYEVAMALVNKSRVTLEQGDAMGTLELIDRALPVLRREFDDNHISVVTALVTQAAAKYKQFEDAASVEEHTNDLLEDAIAHLEKAHRVQEQVKHPHRAKTLGTLGLCLARRDPARAELLLEQAIEIIETNYGSEHPYFARILGNLGNLIRRRGDQKGAIKHLERVIAILKRKLEPDSTTIAIHRLNLGLALMELEQLGAALEHFEHCFQVFSRNFGAENSNTIQALELRDEVQRKQAIIQQSRIVEDASWIELLNQLINDPSLLNTQNLLTIAQGCIEAYLISWTMTLLQVIPENENPFDVLFLRAQCQLLHSQFNEFSDSLSCCLVLAEEDNKFFDLYYGLIEMRDQRERDVDENEEWLRVFESKDTMTVEDQIKKSQLLVMCGRFDDALELINKVISLNPPREVLAFAYQCQARYYLAKENYQQAQFSCKLCDELTKSPDLKEKVRIIENKIAFDLEIIAKLKVIIAFAEKFHRHDSHASGNKPLKNSTGDELSSSSRFFHLNNNNNITVVEEEYDELNDSSNIESNGKSDMDQIFDKKK